MPTKKDYDEFMDDEYTSPEEARAKISMLLAKTGRPDLLSELKDSEIKLVSVLQTVATRYDIDLLDNLVDNILRFRISKDRQGRQELMKMGGIEAGDKGQKKSLKNMVLGLK